MSEEDALNAPLQLRSFVTFRLSRLQAQINAQAQHILRAHSDIGQSEWRVLVLVADRGTGTMAQIVRDGQMDKAQVSRAVSSLVDKGYLTSETNPDDLRQSILTTTPTGRTVHAHVLPRMQARQRALLAGFSDAQIVQLYTMLEQLESAAELREF